MKRQILLLAIIMGLVSCGGGSNTAESNNDSRNDQQLASDRIQQAESIRFPAKIVAESFAEQAPLSVTGIVWASYQRSYSIGTLDQLNNFNQIVGPEQQITASDLDTHSYFLILKSDCTSHSEVTGVEHELDQVTINLNRFAPTKTASCTTADSASFHVFKARKVHAPEILFQTLTYSTQPSIRASGTEVIRNTDEWASLWAKHHQPLNAHTPGTMPPLPTVDFSKNMLVSVYTGASPNGCHGVNIDRIYESGETLTVEYAQLFPSAGDICTQAFIYPWQVVVIPNSPHPVQFVRTVRD